MEWSLAKCCCQASSATISSGRPPLSFSSVYCFFVTRFKSSCNASKSHANNSCESCWPPPPRWGACFETHTLNFSGATLLVDPAHNSLHNSAYFLATTPFVPNGLEVFSSLSCLSLWKYWVKGRVLETACRAAFMKHVLPKLWRPVAPGGRQMVGRRSTLSSWPPLATNWPISSGHVRSLFLTSISIWSESLKPKSWSVALSSSNRLAWSRRCQRRASSVRSARRAHRKSATCWTVARREKAAVWDSWRLWTAVTGEAFSPAVLKAAAPYLQFANDIFVVEERKQRHNLPSDNAAPSARRSSALILHLVSQYSQVQRIQFQFDFVLSRRLNDLPRQRQRTSVPQGQSLPQGVRHENEVTVLRQSPVPPQSTSFSGQRRHFVRRLLDQIGIVDRSGNVVTALGTGRTARHSRAGRDAAAVSSTQQIAHRFHTVRVELVGYGGRRAVGRVADQTLVADDALLDLGTTVAVVAVSFGSGRVRDPVLPPFGRNEIPELAHVVSTTLLPLQPPHHDLVLVVSAVGFQAQRHVTNLEQQFQQRRQQTVVLDAPHQIVFLR